jgi:hypothetical protein
MKKYTLSSVIVLIMVAVAISMSSIGWVSGADHAPAAVARTFVQDELQACDGSGGANCCSYVPLN